MGMEAEISVVTAALAASLRVLETKMDALGQRLDERYRMQQQAVDKAFETMELWKSGANQWRDALHDNNAMFLTRNEYVPAHLSLIEKMDNHIGVLTAKLESNSARITLIEGKSVGVGSSITTILLFVGLLISLAVGGFTIFGSGKTVALPSGHSSATPMMFHDSAQLTQVRTETNNPPEGPSGGLPLEAIPREAIPAPWRVRAQGITGGSLVNPLRL